MNAYTLQDLLKEPEVNYKTFLGNWVREHSCSMLYGWRGTGKSWVGMSIAWAIASSAPYLSFAPGQKKAKVFYLDTELGKTTIRQRFQKFMPHTDQVGDPDLLDICPQSFDQLPKGEVPNLSDPGNIPYYTRLLEGYDVIILDNISGLVRQYKRESEAETWVRVQGFLNNLRSQGKAVLLIHHAGKSGAQRGTSVREDALDFVVALKPAKRLGMFPGANFELHFEKIRDEWRPEYRSIWVSFDGTTFKWHFEDLEQKLLSRAQELIGMGLTEIHISQLLGISSGELREMSSRHDVSLKRERKNESVNSISHWQGGDEGECF